MEDISFNKKRSYNVLLDLLQGIRDGNVSGEVAAEFPGFGGMKEFLLPLDDLTDWTKSDLEVHDLVRQAHQQLRVIFGGQYDKVVDSIKNSMLTSFYTHSGLVQSMVLPVLDKLQGNSILEPSAGLGFYIKAIKDSGRAYDITGVEKEMLTAKILSSLYPELNIINSGLEELKADKGYDLVTSNIPFGQVSVYDAQIYKEANAVKVKATTRIHNYFAVKGLDHLKEGGFMAYLVSSGLMDSPANSDVRRFLVSKANFIEAVRLPNNALRSSGTSPVTDIIILQKDSAKANGLSPNDKLFIESGKVQIGEKELSMNAYYGRHQEKVIGRLALGGQYSGESLDVVPVEGRDYTVEVRKHLSEALENVSLVKARLVSMEGAVEAKDNRVLPDKYPNRNMLKEGNLVTLGVEVGKVNYSDGVPVFRPLAGLRDYLRVNQICQIRDTANLLLEAELGNDEKGMNDLRTELNSLYDQFVFSYGVLNNAVNKRVLGCDAEGFKLLSLERKVDDNHYIKSDLFKMRVNNAEAQVVANTIQDAMVLSLNGE